MHPTERHPQRIAAGLSRISLLLRHHQWRAAAGLALTPTQAQVLALLAAHPPAGLRLGEIARQLAVTPPTATDAVTALEAKRLVRRGGDADDARAVRIRLTARGRRRRRPPRSGRTTCSPRCRSCPRRCGSSFSPP